MKNTNVIKGVFIPVLFAILGTGCRLTKTDITGTWKVSATDTLYIQADNQFRYVSSKGISLYRNPYKIDSTIQSVSGKWYLDKSVVRLVFNDTTYGIGGGCNSYQYMWTKGSKLHLFRPANCTIPTNQFVSIQKIK